MNSINFKLWLESNTNYRTLNTQVQMLTKHLFEIMEQFNSSVVLEYRWSLAAHRHEFNTQTTGKTPDMYNFQFAYDRMKLIVDRVAKFGKITSINKQDRESDCMNIDIPHMEILISLMDRKFPKIKLFPVNRADYDKQSLDLYAIYDLPKRIQENAVHFTYKFYETFEKISNLIDTA